LERHPDGYRYTQFCEIYRRWLKRRGVSMRQVHRAGEKCFVDYAGQKPRLFDPATGEVIAIELFDSVRHDVLLAKVARRVQDAEILHVLKLILKASGKRGVPQGGVISPLLSNVYLTEVDAMLERAKAVVRTGAHVYVEYARWADDLVVLVNNDRRQDWLVEAIPRRLLEEFVKLDLRVNEGKSRIVDLGSGGELRVPGL
jgi:RNA-directed DNA polymerase